MNKFLLMCATTLMFGLSAQGQLTIRPTGQAMFGRQASTLTLNQGVATPQSATNQNITLSRDASYNGSLVFMGSAVSSRQKEGPVVLAGGSFDISGHTVVLGPGTEIKEGTTVKITTNQNL